MTLQEKQDAAIAKATALKNALNTAIASGLWNPNEHVKVGGQEMGPPRQHWSVISQFKDILQFTTDENGVQKAEVKEILIRKNIAKSWI